MFFFQVPGDIQPAQEARVQKMRNFGLTVQPYIIAVGPSLENLDSFYVSIDSTLYKVPSALKAFDICFKSFYALNAVYSPESEHIWYLIQLSLYKFKTKWDKQVSYIMEIANTMP